MITLSRRAALALIPVVWGIALPAAHAGMPWALSLLGTRHGWMGAAPGSWNWLGLLPVAASALGLIWVLLGAQRRIGELPERMTLDWSPKHFETRGPYSFTRHPMYLAELSLWLGWSLFFGSLAVAAGALLLVAGMNILARREESLLEARFGDAYREYARRVPRWLGVRRR